MITLIFQCRVFSMTPRGCARARNWRLKVYAGSPYLAARARRRPSSSVRRKTEYRLNEIAEAPPSRRQRVALIVGRWADRRRWLGAPLAHEDFGASKPNAAQ